MTEYNIGFNSLNLGYLPNYNAAGFYPPIPTDAMFNFDYPIIPDYFSMGSLFPVNTANFLMPEFTTFGFFDPFGFSSTGFDYMPAFFEAQQQQNMFTKMWNNIMELAKNYKMPQFNFNFTNTSSSSGYGNYNQKATDLYKGSAEDLNKHLSGVLAGKGKKFIELQNKYGISAAFLAAIANNESSYGTSPAARNKNNVAGIMSASSKFTKLATFKSVDDCLDAMAKNLKNNYVDEGLVTISQIHEKYAPIGSGNDPTGLNNNWGRVVAQLTDKYNNLS